MALYLLKQYQNRGIGYALINESLRRVTQKQVVLFVLNKNINAIHFYQKVGFKFTGHQIIQPVKGGRLIELEMILNR